MASTGGFDPLSPGSSPGDVARSMWNGKPIVMILDHINGNSKDNRIKNLRMICPNCNSQTSTFAGRNYKRNKKRFFCQNCGGEIGRYSKFCLKCVGKFRRKVVNRPDKEILQKMISEMSWSDIGKKYDVSNNSVRKWAIEYGLLTEKQIRSGRGSEKLDNKRLDTESIVCISPFVNKLK